MTDRTRSPQTNGPTNSPEVPDLTDLHALKPSPNATASSFDASNTDLTQASIQVTNVVRLSARPEKRSISSTLSTPNLGATASTSPKESLSRPNASIRGQKHGIFKNPHHRYEGGPLGRLISFFANLLKVLERLILGLLMTRPKAPSVTPNLNQPKPDLSKGAEREKKKRPDTGLTPRRE